MLTKEQKTNILLGLFVGSIVAANLIGLKIADFKIFQASVGILVFPLTFLITDIVSEVLGKKKAKEFVYVGLVTLVFISLITLLAVKLPFAERSFVKDDYTKIFGTSLRIFLASILAFLFSQLHDVWAFHFWKKTTKGRALWLRNNLSTIITQFIDTTLFMFVAFYRANDKFTIFYVFSLILAYWLVKVLFALGDTPFCYLGVKWLKGKSGE